MRLSGGAGCRHRRRGRDRQVAPGAGVPARPGAGRRSVTWLEATASRLARPVPFCRSLSCCGRIFRSTRWMASRRSLPRSSRHAAHGELEPHPHPLSALGRSGRCRLAAWMVRRSAAALPASGVVASWRTARPWCWSSKTCTGSTPAAKSSRLSAGRGRWRVAAAPGDYRIGSTHHLGASFSTTLTLHSFSETETLAMRPGPRTAQCPAELQIV